MGNLTYQPTALKSPLKKKLSGFVRRFGTVLLKETRKPERIGYTLVEAMNV